MWVGAEGNGRRLSLSVTSRKAVVRVVEKTIGPGLPCKTSPRKAGQADHQVGVTEQEIPKILAGNIEWIHSAYRLEVNPEMDIAELHSLATILKSRLQENNNTINKVTTALDREMNLESGTSLYLFRHLLARKEILMNMATKISACSSVKAIKRIVF